MLRIICSILPFRQTIVLLVSMPVGSISFPLIIISLSIFFIFNVLRLILSPGIDFMPFDGKEHQIDKTRNKYPVTDTQTVLIGKVTIYQR